MKFNRLPLSFIIAGLISIGWTSHKAPAVENNSTLDRKEVFVSLSSIEIADEWTYEKQDGFCLTNEYLELSNDRSFFMKSETYCDRPWHYIAGDTYSSTTMVGTWSLSNNNLILETTRSDNEALQSAVESGITAYTILEISSLTNRIMDVNQVNFKFYDSRNQLINQGSIDGAIYVRQ